MHRVHYTVYMRLPLLWRLLAILSLLTLGLIVMVSINFIITNPLIIPLVLALSFSSLCGAWIIFIGLKKRLLLGWLIMLGSLATLIVILIFSSNNSDNSIVIRLGFLICIYAFLVSWLREKYWSLRRESSLRQKSKSSFKNPYLIINPKSGDGRAIKANIPARAKKLGIKVVVTKKSDNITQLAQNALKNGADVLGVSGGDGTIGAVATVAIEHNLPLVVLPGGTRCHFARDTGLDPKKIVDSLACFNGVEVRIDVGSINGRIFLNNASLGLYADIINNDQYREHKIATTRSTLQKLFEEQKQYSLSFDDDKGTRIKRVVQVLIGVNAYKTMNVFELGHRTSLTGQTLQVTAITQLTRTLLTSFMKTIALNKDFIANNAESIRQWETQSIKINAPTKSIVVGVDGEREEYATPVTIKVLPGALRLMTLPEGLRQRPKNIFSADAIKTVWLAFIGKDV